jgi:hypothetical protein
VRGQASAPALSAAYKRPTPPSRLRPSFFDRSSRAKEPGGEARPQQTPVRDVDAGHLLLALTSGGEAFPLPSETHAGARRSQERTCSSSSHPWSSKPPAPFLLLHRNSGTEGTGLFSPSSARRKELESSHQDPHRPAHRRRLGSRAEQRRPAACHPRLPRLGEHAQTGLPLIRSICSIDHEFIYKGSAWTQGEQRRREVRGHACTFIC